MTDNDHLDRINALTRNARATWFTLLAALVFVGITLMGVEHIDFYGVDRATELPLVSVEVPTRYFFVAAPILIAAIYGYFHLYLIRLWDALGAAPTRLNGVPLGDAITPWLVSDAALHFRARTRKDNCTTPRALEAGAMILNLALAWGFGLFVLAALWWLSMPARDFRMTGVAGLSLLVALFAGGASLAAMWTRLRRATQSRHVNIIGSVPAMGLMIAVIPFVLALSHERSRGSTTRLAPLDLTGEALVERPAGWLSYADARAEFRATWCRREMDGKHCRDFGDREAGFTQEFDRRRRAALADMRRPDWHKPGLVASDMDFRGANLTNSFFAGANLSEAQMEGADLRGAQMEGAVLRGAQMEGAVLSGAQMEGADLRGAQMEGAVLFGAQMEGANLFGAQMEGAILREAQMEGAILREAQMEGANLFGAQMEGAVLHYAYLSGTIDRINVLIDTNLSASTNIGGAVRFVDLSQAIFNLGTDFRNVFLDGTVQMTPEFRTQMGNPCQWADAALDDAEFYGRWRGWIQAAPADFALGWEWFAPDGFADVQAIPPPPGCTWQTGPMPGTEDAR